MIATVSVVSREDVMQVLLERPWARVKDPVTIPELAGVEDLLAMENRGLAELLRDNLVPRVEQPEGRRRWEQLWALLGSDADLADRAFDVLEDLLDTTEDALTDQRLDAAQTSRARKFRTFCEDAWKRLQIDDDRPLGWAGRAAAGFNPPARRVLEQLVDAISDHRRTVSQARKVGTADEQLWQVLRTVNLDPDESRRHRK